MPRIYFTSGKTLDISDEEFKGMSPKLNGGGIRVYRTFKNDLIPLNSNTMELVERNPDDFETEKVLPTRPSKAEVEVIVEKKEAGEAVEAKEPVPELPAPVKETADEYEARILAETKAKSDCKHEPEKLEIYKQDTSKGVRYFPVCSFCGKRERYVKADSLSGVEKLNAKIWQEV